MLMLTLPKSELTGTCCINGESAQYRVSQDHLEFRYEGQEAWDRRRILDAFQDGDLIRYTCDNGPESEGPYVVVRPQTAPQQNEEFYWLAINGASCAASSVPLRPTLQVHPTPEQLIGFRTRDEQLSVQQFLLSAPIDEVEKFMREEMPRKVHAGEVLYIRPANPEPPTRGTTLWDLGDFEGGDQ